jgi:hypothetical protein
MIKALAAGVLILAAVTSAPFAPPAVAAEPVTASGAATDIIAADRIGRAFASLSEAAVDPAIAADARAPKGDFAPACANAVWPNIEAACLVTADGGPAPVVRTITIGYQAGENTTVLVRIPAAEIAQR